MMPNEFIKQLADRRIYLSSDGVALKFRAPEGAMDETIKLMIRQYKNDLVKVLQKYAGQLLICPLSYNQQSLFFMNLLEPAASSYNLALSMRLLSSVDEGLIESAMNKVVQRHEQLRTTYRHIELGDAVIPVQFVHERLSPSFEIIDASGWTQAKLKESLQAFYKTPFDLEHGPMVRAALFRTGVEETVFVTVFHHIAMDAWSLNIIMRDLAAAYRGDDELSGVARATSEYTEFAVSQHRDLEEPAGMAHLDYWIQMHKHPAPALDLGSEGRRPPLRRSAGATHYFNLDAEVRKKIEGAAQKQGITPFAFLLSVFQWFLFQSSGNRDLTIGIPVMGRKDRRFESTVGYFINPVPIRSIRTGIPSFSDHAQMTAREFRAALDHRDAPFSAIVERLDGVRDTAHTPVFQVMFNMLSRKTLGDVIDLLYPLKGAPILDFGGLNAGACAIDQQEGQFDMTLELIDYNGGILGLWKYCTDLFSSSEAEDMVSVFLARLNDALENPEIPIFVSDGSDLVCRVLESEAPVIAISASFTAEVLQEFLEFWFECLGWRNSICFAQFNQVFQELLNPSSLLRSNRQGHNIVMVRLDDLMESRKEKISGSPEDLDAWLYQILDDLLNAVTTAARAMSVPLCFVLCPSSPESEEVLRQHCEKLETFLETLRSVPNVTVITHDDISRKYPVAEYYEPFGETIGRVPFTRPYLTALATLIARSLHTLSLKPVKALAVDCDWTLWGGVSAEDGATGVTIGPLQRDFQQFLLDQYQAGVVLCLCSKNQENDVWAVFDRHPDMLLKREHFTFWRINWEPKSSNIQSLAREINIGLDAMAFLDDSPIERAEVSLACPSVFCVEFPEEWEERTQWLEHLWALDHGRITAEDRKRQDHYRSEQIRENIKKSAGSLQDFLEKLELKIDIHQADPSDYERLGQLSVRTNQFNTTTLRLTPQEVAEYAESPGLSAHIARVSDRFGDYGLVGGMLAKAVEDALWIEGLFLSCRALGRGVEYRIAAYLASVAQKAGCSAVAFPVKTTERNEPARTFLNNITRLCNGTVGDDGTVNVTVDQLLEIRYEPPQVQEEETEDDVPGEVSVRSEDAASRDNEMYFSIASELRSVDAIMNAVEQRTREQQSRIVKPISTGPAAAPETETEQIIADVWKQVLGLRAVNTRAKFFEVGGTSLLMVRIAIELKNNHGLEVTVLDMFQYPTIADLAKYLDQKGPAPEVAGHVADSALRQREALSAKNLPASFQRLKKSRR